MELTKQISAQSHRISSGLDPIDSVIRNELDIIPEIDLNFLQLTADDEIVEEIDFQGLIEKHSIEGRIPEGILDVKFLTEWFIESKIVTASQHYKTEDIELCLKILKHE